MQQPNPGFNINPQQGTIVVGKTKSRKKTIVLICILLSVLVIILLGVFVVMARQDASNNLPPTPVPSATPFPPTSTPQVTPTQSNVVPTTEEANKQKYILTNCEIEISADSKWVSSPRGELSTCGILSTMGAAGFTSYTDYSGTMIAVIPFATESVFTPKLHNKQKTYQEYLKNTNNQMNRYRPDQDFLYSQKETKIANFPAIEAQIYKAGLGETKQIFYQGFSGQYVIVWGGQTSAELEVEVREIIASAKQLVEVRTEE